VPWTNHQQTFPESESSTGLDSLRASRPSVIEEADGTLRMWYSAHDGSTGRIAEAVQEPGQDWKRLGISVDVGVSGDSDAFGVEAPSVVRTPAGYLMAYAGSDGADTRLHLASSDDGHQWQTQGTFLQRGEPDAVGATHPCLVVTGERWWLFYSGYDGSKDGRRALIMGAVSTDGGSWDRLGPVLSPEGNELAVTEPSILLRQRHLTMFFVSDDDARTSIEVATSNDGVSWARRGSTLRLGRRHHDRSRLRSPAVLRMQDRRLRLWYAARTTGDPPNGCRLWSTDFLKTASQTGDRERA
jgi:predicted GH43/DUF377 family glycosyl hydrolase